LALKKQNFIKGSIILMLSAVLAKLLGALFRIPLTNMLGGVGMSYFSCAYSIFMPVYALTAAGLTSACARLTAQSAALGMYDNARKIRRTAALIFSAAGTVGSLLIWLLAKPFSVHILGSSEAAAAVAMIAPAVLLGCITAVERGYYEGMSNMYPTAFSQLAEGIVRAGAGLYLCALVMERPGIVTKFFPSVTDTRGAAAAAGIGGVTLSMAGAVLFFLVMRLFARPVRGGESHVMSRRAIARELAATALPVGAGSLVTNLTAFIDMWTIMGCISRFGCNAAVPGVSAEELPEFVYGSFSGIALTVFNLVPSVTNMLGKGALTCITSAHESGDRSALEHGTVQALLTSAVIAVPAAVGLGIFAPEVLKLLFPRQSDEAAVCVSALRYLMAGMVCLCISAPLFSMLQAVGRASAPLRIMLLGTAVKLGLNLLLIPFMGADGAAASTSVSYMLILGVSLRVYIKETGAAVPAAPFGKVIYSGAVCGAAALFVHGAVSRSGAPPVIVLAAAAAAGGVIYGVLIYALIGRRAAGNVLSR